ncbi:hypothetical protein BBP40_005330 [Aspergillus hancockii]|nr:hypothetical protein BBP40_005330 [Aspergillus hancockii]
MRTSAGDGREGQQRPNFSSAMRHWSGWYKRHTAAAYDSTRNNSKRKDAFPMRKDPFYKNFHESSTNGLLHDRLQFGHGLPVTSVLAWRIMEYLPIRRATFQPNGSRKLIRWPLHRGRVCDIAAYGVVHDSAFYRMEADPNFRLDSLLTEDGEMRHRGALTENGDGLFVVHEHEGEPVRQTYIRGPKWPTCHVFGGRHFCIRVYIVVESLMKHTCQCWDTFGTCYTPRWNAHGRVCHGSA